MACEPNVSSHLAEQVNVGVGDSVVDDADNCRRRARTSGPCIAGLDVFAGCASALTIVAQAPLIAILESWVVRLDHACFRRPVAVRIDNLWKLLERVREGLRIA